MKFEDIKIPGELTIVTGDKSEKEIVMFALSTCQWCQKAKKWLNDNDYSYQYIDVDLLPLMEKRELKRSLMKMYEVMVRYPFLIVNGDLFHSGFSEEKYKELTA